jgi:hypothetical protein
MPQPARGPCHDRRPQKATRPPACAGHGAGRRGRRRAGRRQISGRDRGMGGGRAPAGLGRARGAPRPAASGLAATRGGHRASRAGPRRPRRAGPGYRPVAGRPAATQPQPAWRRAVAVDGKTLRGSGHHGHAQVHLLAAMDHTSCAVLGQTTSITPPTRSPGSGPYWMGWTSPGGSSPPTHCTPIATTPTGWSPPRTPPTS